MDKLVRTLQRTNKVPSSLVTSAAFSTTSHPLNRCLCHTPPQPCQSLHDRYFLSSIIHHPNFIKAQVRHISITAVLNKKVREELYEKVRVYDPNDTFICDVELLVLEKFCHTYHTYQFIETESKPRDGDEGKKLNGFQLKKKHEGEVEADQRKGAVDRKGKHVKEIKVKANQDPNSSEWKLEKVLQVLLDMGVVNVNFVGKEPKSAIRSMTRGVQEYIKMAQIKQDGSLMQISVPEIDSHTFKALFDHLFTKEAAKIKSVQELMELERDLEKAGQ